MFDLLLVQIIFVSVGYVLCSSRINVIHRIIISYSNV